MSVIKLSQIIDKSDAEIMLAEIKEGASISKASMHLPLQGLKRERFAEMREEIGDRETVEAIMTLATCLIESLPTEEFKHGDIVQHKTTGEMLTVEGSMWWTGSWEARSHSETYEFMGDRLPRYKRVHPSNWNLVERKAADK